MTRLLSSRSLLTTLPAALALLGLVLLLAVTGQPSPAQAQTPTVTLVTNFGQTVSSFATSTKTGSQEYVLSAGFTTGPSAGGYALSSIAVKTHSSQSSIATSTASAIKAELWSAATTTGNPPDTKVYDLTVPAAEVLANRTLTFAAPAGATLAANSKYYLVVYTTDDTNLQLRRADKGNQDFGSATGWSVDNGQPWIKIDRSPGMVSWSQSDNGDIPLIQVSGAEAITSVAVSNFGQRVHSNSTTTEGFVLSTQFTTGSAAAGYTLSNINVKTFHLTSLDDKISTSTSAVIKAEVWSAATTTNNPPDAKVYDLTRPNAEVLGAGRTLLSFTAPANATLEPNSKYYLVVYTTDNTRLALELTESNNEDTASKAGWSIADGDNWIIFAQTPEGASWVQNVAPDVDDKLVFQVNVNDNGLNLSSLTGTASADGTNFSAMTGAGAIVQALAAGAGYRATVGNDITHVKLTPTLADTTSSVKVGLRGTTLAPVTSGSASDPIPLEIGENDITVEVTTSDSSTRAYTVTMRRVTAGTEWHATLLPRALLVLEAEGFGCINVGEDTCAKSDILTSDSFTHATTTYTFTSMVDWDAGNLQVDLDDGVTTEFAELNFCVNGEAYGDFQPLQVGFTTNRDVGWSAGVPVSLSIGTSCGPPPPGFPVGLAVTPGSAKLDLAWTAPEGANSYDVHYTSSTGGGAVPDDAPASGSNPAEAWVAVSRSGTTASQSITGLTNDTPYRVRVRGVGGGGAGAWAWGTGTPKATTSGSADASLSALTLGTGETEGGTFTDRTLMPAFNGATYAYTVNVAAGQRFAKVTPTVNESNATVKVNGKPVTSGAVSGAVGLGYGAHWITVEVTAQNGSTRNYTVTVTVALPTVEWPGGRATTSGIEGDTSLWVITPSYPNDMVGTLRYADGTAIVAEDVDNTSTGRFTMSISGGDTTLSTISFVIVDDGVNEADETFTVTFEPGEGYTVGSNATLEFTIIDIDVPAAPGNLTLAPRDGALTANWDEPVGPVTGYKLRWKETAAPDSDATGDGTDPSTGWVTGSETSSSLADIRNLTNGTSYDVQVRATDGTRAGPGNDGYGEWSASASATPADPLAPVILVRNIILAMTNEHSYGANGYVNAQAFTTGSHVGGYPLSYIGAMFESDPNAGELASVRAELWSATTDGAPNTKIVTLTVPSSITTGVEAPFTPEDITVLEPDTSYFFLVYTTGDYDLRVDYTTSTSEDSGGAAGWSIEDTRYYKNNQQPGGSNSWVSASNPLRIGVFGRNRLSINADLASLTASGSDSAGGAFTEFDLTPAFDAATTEYAAKVAHSVTHAKLTPTVDDTGKATVQVGPQGGTLNTVIDGQPSAALALSLGDNAFTVSVTPEDGPPAKDYTVTITRGDVPFSLVGPLVTNADETPDSTNASLTTSRKLAQAFTAGSNDEGYALDTVQVEFVTNLSQRATEGLEAEIWSDSSGAPGSSILKLVAPAHPISAGKVTFTAQVLGARTLIKDTTYWLVIFNDDSISNHLKTTASDDQASDYGFTIADTFRYQDSTTWETPTGGRSLLMTVNGREIPEKSYTFSPSSATTPNGRSAGLGVALSEAAPAGGLELTLTPLFGEDMPAGLCEDTPLADADDLAPTAPTTVTVEEGEERKTFEFRLADNGDDYVGGNGECFGVGAGTDAADWGPGAIFVGRIRNVLGQGLIAIGNDAEATSKHTATVEESAGTLSVPVTVDFPPNADTTFTIEVLNTGTATEWSSAQSPGDFRIATKTLTFGKTTAKTQNLTVTLTDDDEGESDETIQLRIRDAQGSDSTFNSYYLRNANGKLATITITSEDVTVSANANLSALTAATSTSATGAFSPLTLSPAFDAATTAYSATVANNITHAKLTPTVADTGKATVTVNGTAVNDGAASGALSLNVGANTLTVQVTAEDTTTKNYIVTITREGIPPGAVTGLSVTPDDTRLDLSWMAPTSTGSSALTGYDVHYTTAPSTGSGAVLDDAPASGSNPATAWVAVSRSGTTASQAITGLTNDTLHRVRVRAVNASGGGAWERGTGTPSAGPSQNANLSALVVTSATGASGTYAELALAPAFAAGTTSYAAPAPNAATHVKVRPTTEDSGATLTVNGTAVTSGQESAAIALGAITVRVTAEDTTITKDYTVAVARRAVVTLAASPNPVAEGSSVTVTARLSAALSAGVTIPLSLTSGTAESGDFSGPTSLAIAPGASSGTATITTTRDADAEHETFTVALGTPLPTTVEAGTPSSVEVRIEDVPDVSLEVSASEVDEGDSVTVTARLSESLPSAVTIPLATTRDTSESGDHGSLSGIRIASGATSGTGTIATRQDADIEDETFTVALGTSLPSPLVAGTPSSVQVNIVDDDELTVTLRSSTLRPGEGGTARLTATLSNPAPAGGFTLQFTVNGAGDNPAAPLTDYTLDPASEAQNATAPLTIAEGQRAASATLRVVNDTEPEDDEGIQVGIATAYVLAQYPDNLQLTVPANDGWGRSSSVAWIDAVPNPVSEGSEVEVRVFLSETAAADVRVPLTTRRGTAEDGDHGTLDEIVIAAGASLGTGTISTTRDGDADDETFTVRLGTLPSGVRAGAPSSVEVVITDMDKPRVGLEVEPDVVDEGGSVTMTARLTAPLTRAVTIPLTVERGTSESGDHGSLSGIRIASGATSGTGTIATRQDADYDDETFSVTLGENLPASVAAGHPDSVVITIADDDDPPQISVSLLAEPLPVPEGESVTVTALLTAPLTRAVTIPVAVERGTSESGDHGSLSSIRIASGATSGSGTVTTQVDSDTDDETFTVKLRSNQSAGVAVGYPDSVVITIADRGGTVPGRVRSLRVTAGDGKLELSWTAPSSGTVSFYQVEYKERSASEWQPVYESGGNYADAAATIDVANGTTYDVRVRASNEYGVGPWATGAGAPRSAKSSNANLSSLSVTASATEDGSYRSVSLSPSFRQSVTAYTASLPAGTKFVKIRPRSAAASVDWITVDGREVVSGAESAAIAVHHGEIVWVTVISEDQSADREYTVTMSIP